MELKIKKQTICDQIVEYFKNEIESGKLKPGDAFPSERALENDLNISRKTISKAVSVLAASGYLFKEQGKSTFVADYKHGLSGTNGRGDVAFIFDSPLTLQHPYQLSLSEKIVRILAESGIGVKLIYHRGKVDDSFVAAISQNNLKAVFLFETIYKLVCNEMYDMLAKTNLLVISFVKQFAGRFGNMCNFYADEDEAMCEAVELLLAARHKRIVFLSGVLWEGEQMRINVFKNALEAQGELCDEQSVQITEYNHKKTVKAVRKAIEQSPDAIICADDMVARWTIDILATKNIRVPDDVSVIGFNDMDMYSLRDPELTTFKYPYQQIAEFACKKVLSVINNRQKLQSESKAFSYNLIERATVLPRH